MTPSGLRILSRLGMVPQKLLPDNMATDRSDSPTIGYSQSPRRPQHQRRPLGTAAKGPSQGKSTAATDQPAHSRPSQSRPMTIWRRLQHRTTLPGRSTKVCLRLANLVDFATKPISSSSPRQPCLVCGRSPADAHHLRFTQPRAMGLKVSDEFTVPLCRVHHRDNHSSGDEVAWWERRAMIPSRPRGCSGFRPAVSNENWWRYGGGRWSKTPANSQNSSAREAREEAVVMS